VKISLVICTYNRSAYLRQTLDSVLTLRSGESLEWEVVVVDNNSADDTAAVIEAYAQGRLSRLRGFFEKKQGLSNARNRGIQEARGEIVAFLDDDIILDPEWLMDIARAFEEHGAACVAGKVRIHSSVKRPGWWHGDYDSVLGQCDRGDQVIVAVREHTDIVGIGANMSYRKWVFAKYGLFDPNLGRIGNQLKMGEESELNDRLILGGERVIYHPSPLVHHCPDTSRFTKQYLRRWYYRLGEYLGWKDKEKNTPAFLGMPRWRIGMWLSLAAKRSVGILAGSEPERFRLETKLAFQTGYLAAKLRNRNEKR
jgi:glycosyltransferase involved in cell wall biosynthesis